MTQHRFMLMSLVPGTPGQSVHQRFREIAEVARLAEALGFDGFGVGERHDQPYLSSSPAVLLGYLAGRTERIRLFTAATTIAMHDPVRAYEDYATADQLSDGRLELIVGTGLGDSATRLFGIPTEEQTARTVAAYELFRTLWHEHPASCDDSLRPALDAVQLQPLPAQQRLPVWHAGLTSRESAARAARWGEPLVTGNLYGTIDEVARHIQMYREEWAAHGRDPPPPRVGVGVAGIHVAERSQDARTEFRPAFACQMELATRLTGRVPYDSFDSYLDQSTALVGSPAEVAERFARLQERFSHVLTYHHADSPGMDPKAWQRGKELFASHLIRCTDGLGSPPGTRPNA